MINLLTVAVGTHLKLAGGVVAEVVENMDDGQWLRVRYLTVEGHPEQEGAEDLAHAGDVLAVVAPPPAAPTAD